MADNNPIDEAAFDILETLYRSGMINSLPADMRRRIKAIVDPSGTFGNTTIAIPTEEDFVSLDDKLIAEREGKELLRRVHEDEGKALDDMTQPDESDYMNHDRPTKPFGEL